MAVAVWCYGFVVPNHYVRKISTKSSLKGVIQ